MKNTIYLKIVFYLLINTFVFSQEKKSVKIELISYVKENKILLKWAVDSPLEWQKSHKYGFKLQKFLYKKADKILEKPEKINLIKDIFKPENQEAWQKIIEKDDYAKIVAGSIFGESFSSGLDTNSSFEQIVNTNDELTQRFSFGLMASDFSFQAAKLAGWAYEDLDVKKDEVYIYQILPLIPDNKIKIQESSIIIGLKDFQKLPKPNDFQAIFEDKNVVLAWDYDLLKSVYNSYFLEKSEDGINFSVLNKTPIVNISDKENKTSKRIYFVDSLKQNDKKYYYRLQGMNPFSEKGEFSEIISGQGFKSEVFVPNIINFEFNQNPNEVIINWEYPKESQNDISKFEIHHSKNDKIYKKIQDEIPVSNRSFLLKNLETTNYIKVFAIGKNKEIKESFTKLIQPLDSIAPNVPKDFKGKIDSLGIVKLSWKPNIEKDLKGYQLFKANTKNEEFTPINSDFIINENFTDSIQIKTLNKKIYYKIKAFDFRFNESKFSEILELEIPNKIAEPSPVFTDYKIENGKVILSWNSENSTNETIKIFRKSSQQNEPLQQIFETKDKLINSFTDSKVKANINYEYQIFSFSKQGLKSIPSNELSISVFDLEQKEYIKSFNYNVFKEEKYIELFWNIEDKSPIQEFIIYKNIKNKQPIIWKVLPANLNRIIDTQINPNNEYTYTIKAVLSSAETSNYKTITIIY